MAGKTEDGSQKTEVKKWENKSVSSKPEAGSNAGQGSGLAKKKKSKPEIMPVEELAEAEGIKSWEVAGLMRAAGWAPGKQVSKGEFDLALGRFRRRPQGGGRI